MGGRQENFWAKQKFDGDKEIFLLSIVVVIPVISFAWRRYISL